MHEVSTHSRLKAAGSLLNADFPIAPCFNTQPPEGGWRNISLIGRAALVSTHSRLKAAGLPNSLRPSPLPSFNTQPPEGGWIRIASLLVSKRRFNTQPPEGGWSPSPQDFHRVAVFQHTAA